MTRDVVFRPQAEDEALEVRRWYEARREGLGNKFGAEGRGVLKNFPYAIYFRETTKEIIVLAIHGRQDPSRWQTRS